VQDGAPAPRTTTDDIISRAGRIRARRAATAVAGGVIACVALTTAAVTTLGASGADVHNAAAPPVAASAAPAPSASAPPAPISSAAPVQPDGFRTRLGEYRVGEYKIGPAGQVAPGYQQIPVYRDGSTWSGDDGVKYPLAEGTITVYRAGVYDPDTFGRNGDGTLLVSAPYEVKVAGRAGTGQDFTYVSPVDGERLPVRAALAWQYAPDAWATFLPDYSRDGLPRADVAKIAAGLVTDRDRELRVPYRIGFLPDGWRPVAVTQTDNRTSTTVSRVFLHKGPLTESAARPIDEVFPRSAMINVFRGDPKDETISGKDGVHCATGRTSCMIVKGDYLIEVTDWNGGLSAAEVRQIAEGLQLKDLADQKTWLPLRD